MSRLLVRVLVALTFSFTVARAQNPGGSGTGAIVIAPDRPLSVEEAIALALEKNFNLRIQALSVENTRENVVIQEAAFDPTLTAGITRSLNQAASTTNRLDGTAAQGPRNDNTQLRFGASLPRLTATNGTLSVNTNVSRAGTNSTNALLNPSYGNSISATLNQPLLRDFGRRAALAALEQAQLSLNIAHIGYKGTVLSLISDTENAYYALVAARQALHIRQLTLEGARRLFDEISVRRTSGVATDLDVLSAEVQVENGRRALVQQEQSVRNAEERLLNLINVPTFDVRPGPVAFDEYRDGAPNFAQSYKLAREFYPDTLSTEQVIRQAELSLATAKRNLLPDLNLQATLGYTARPTDASYFETIGNLPSQHGNNWSLNLNYSLPWGRRADHARYRQANNTLASQKIRLEQFEQQLIVSVRTAVRAVETNLVAAEIAAKATDLAARQFEQQKARYDAGLSTSRVLLQFQDDLENARFNQLSAQLALRQAVAELRRLEGTSLQRFRVQLPE
jgi:outer membrane protein TolC